MKKTLFYSVCLLGLLFNACQSDDEGPDSNEFTNNDPTGLLLDGGSISDVHLYCLPEDGNSVGMQWWEYYPMTKTLEDYSKLRLYIMFDESASVYHSDDPQEMNEINRVEQKVSKEKSRFIVDELKEYRKSDHPDTPWEDFYTAYVNGKVTITCDKVLFGEKPGEDLSKYFSLLGEFYCMPVGIENPHLLYQYGDPMPLNMKDFLVDQSWVRHHYWLEFQTDPTEKYEELTFTLTFPMAIEHTLEYAVSQYKGENKDMRLSTSTFTSECLIRFE